MTDEQKIIKKFKEGVLRISYKTAGKIVASGSAFLVKNFIVTNNHVYLPELNSGIKISEVCISNFSSSKSFTFEEFQSLFYQGSPKDEHDWALLHRTRGIFNGCYEFDLENYSALLEGGRVLLMGFPFSANHISSHFGYVSAKYNEHNVDKFQLDASINMGNSGGPLINLETGRVAGIVTRKGTGLSENFRDLTKSFTEISEMLRSRTNMQVAIGGINPIEFFATVEDQMSTIADNIKRSANVGIGYAFSVEPIRRLIADSHGS